MDITLVLQVNRGGSGWTPGHHKGNSLLWFMCLHAPPYTVLEVSVHLDAPPSLSHVVCDHTARQPQDWVMGLPAHTLSPPKLLLRRDVWLRRFLEKWQKVKGLVKNKPSAESAAPFGCHRGPNGSCLVFFFFFNGLMCQGDIWQFTALTLQKAKLSDEPVKAKEDYTKFNSKDFKTVKVCVWVLAAYSWIPWLLLLCGDFQERLHAWLWFYHFNH